MEEAADNHESAPKRSRSDEEFIADKDVFSSAETEQQNSQDRQEQLNMSVCSSNNNNNRDIGLSLKMEESSCGDADIIGDGILKFENKDESSMAELVDTKQREDGEDQLMLTNESINQAERNPTQIVDKDEKSDSGESDVDNKPITSTHIIKRRKRSRNYRLASRSSSSSSNSSSTEHGVETRSEEHQQQPEEIESQEIANAVIDPALPANNNEADLQASPSPYMLISDLRESLSIGLSSDNSTDSDEPAMFEERLSFDISSDDSDNENFIKKKNEEVNKVLNKEKPSYTWSCSYELMLREHGLSSDGRTSLRNGFSSGFKNRFYASRHIVEKMKISHVLRKHSGCVNCVNFNKTGDLLVTGSDDARLIVWDWAANKIKHVWKSGHSSNIFQSKFLPTSSCIDIISAGRDGKVRRSIVPPSGGKVQVSDLYLHSGAVHKLVICPENPSQFISVGEDGCIWSKDLREDNPKVDMLKVTTKSRKVRLFSISHHPFAPEICVSGSDKYVRVYDKRSMNEAVHTMSPENILKTSFPIVTCCVYNNTGTEILATYSGDDIYLFDNKNYIPGKYLHSYKGHYNEKTIKGVNFFGPNCEYVISGSDCSNIFYWDKNTEAILNFMPGDTAGVVNCLEPHPSTPILATSGLDHDIKIWTPSAEKYPPDLTKLTNCLRSNIGRRGVNHGTQFDDEQMQYFIRQILCRNPATREDAYDSDDSENMSSDDSSEPEFNINDSDDDVSDSNFRHLACRPQ